MVIFDSSSTSMYSYVKWPVFSWARLFLSSVKVTLIWILMVHFCDTFEMTKIFHLVSESSFTFINGRKWDSFKFFVRWINGQRCHDTNHARPFYAIKNFDCFDSTIPLLVHRLMIGEKIVANYRYWWMYIAANIQMGTNLS